MPPRSSSKKYKLFAQSSLGDPSSKPVCAFFSSDAGCRNGSKCNFLHVTSSDAAEVKGSSSTSSSSVVSSESEDEVQTNHAEASGQMNRKRKLEDSNASPFVAPGQSLSVPPENKKSDQRKQKQQPQPQPQPQPPQQQQAKKKKKKNKKDKNHQKAQQVQTPPTSGLDDDDPFAPIASTAPAPTPDMPATSTVGVQVQQHQHQHQQQQHQHEQRQHQQQQRANDELHRASRKQKKPSSGNAGTPNFRSLLENLPVASFSLPTENAATGGTKGEDEEEEEDDDGDAEAASSPPSEGAVNIPLPLPNSSPDGAKWKEMVIQTRQHPRYAACFNFAKAREADEDGSSAGQWIKTKPFGPWCADNPQVIAIDCEMCETQDPVSGKTDPKALCRLSVVNAADPGEVLLDTLVKPDWPVKDHRSWVNGIDASHLDSVQFTLRHAQAYMLALCSEETVIVGHSLHNDLVAMKLEHHCNVDSSFLFPVAGVPDEDRFRIIPSLRDLAKSVMGKQMPKTHDSVNDARTALLCLEAYREKGGKVDPIVRTVKPKAGEKLLVHRIPKHVREDHLSKMFVHHTSVVPKSTDKIEFSGVYGKTFVSFSSVAHANLAFDTLEGKAEADKSQMLQKKVYLKNKSYIRVRKMVVARSLAHGKPQKK